MSALAPAFVLPPTSVPPVPGVQGVPGVQSAAELAKRGQIKDTATKFEASFLSIMVQQMFAGKETSGPFDGGPGEQMFQSFMAEAIANKIVKGGGIGLAGAVQREMLKMQGLH